MSGRQRYNWWQRWDSGDVRQVHFLVFFFLCTMESADGRVLAPDSLDSGSTGQREAPRSWGQTARATWSVPGLAEELESLLAGNLEQLSMSARREPGGVESAGRGDLGLSHRGNVTTSTRYSGGLPPCGVVGARETRLHLEPGQLTPVAEERVERPPAGPPSPSLVRPSPASAGRPLAAGACRERRSYRSPLAVGPLRGGYVSNLARICACLVGISECPLEILAWSRERPPRGPKAIFWEVTGPC